MDLLVLLVGVVLLISSAVFKLDALFAVAFLVAIFNDFIRTAIIRKRSDERAVLIKSKSDSLTYFVIYCLLIATLGVAVKQPQVFQSVPQMLFMILTAICLIHSLMLSIFQRKL
ncbi:MAG: hypothetical protein LKF71_05840 [Oscillospiraceae bacterium]|jgi:hypothetical protein|nr:hypothetical protein [Oscillospiraceae bacterium]